MKKFTCMLRKPILLLLEREHSTGRAISHLARKSYRSVLEKKEKIVLSWSCVIHMFCLKWNKSENKLNSWYYCVKNVVRYAGDRPESLGALWDHLRLYTQKFQHNSEKRKLATAFLKTNENRMSDYNNVTKSYSFFINTSIGHNNEFPVYFRPVGRRSRLHMGKF